MLSTNFVMMVRIRGNVSADQLAAALNRVRTRHPALVPGDAMTFPLSVRVDCIESDWIEAAQAELRESFPDQPGPFARFIMLKHSNGFDLVATFHHGICDGMSGMFFLRDVLQTLGHPELPITPIALPSNRSLIPDKVLTNPAFQRKVAFAVTLLRAKVFVEQLRRRFSLSKPVQMLETDSSMSRQFIILPVRLTVEQTAALVARCKKEQVSVHAAVCVAWLRAFTAAGSREKLRVGSVSSPVNLRERYAQSVGETSGLFLSIVETSIDVGPDRTFWDAAREFKQKLSQDSRDEAVFFKSAIFAKIFTQISDAERDILIAILFSGPVKYDFSITNLGRIVIPERSGDLQVEAFYGPLVNSSPYERTVGVSTLAGQMSISFIFRPSIMSVADGRLLMDCALEILLTALK